MKPVPHPPALLTLSERVYHVLLLLYPADFRRDYGQQLTQVFRDTCRDSYGQEGTAGLIVWWMIALFDLVKTVLIEHRKAGFNMSQTRFIQSSGWLLMAGGLCFLAGSLGQLQPNSGMTLTGQLSLYALVPGMALVMLGLVGLWLRYNTALEWLGKTALLTVIAGAGLTAAGWLLTLAAGNNFLMVFIVGWMIQMAGHSVFGGVATTTHLLPRWNFALLIGSALPLTIAVLVLSRQTTASGANWAAFAVLLLIGIGWLLTGWALNTRSDMSVQPVTSR